MKIIKVFPLILFFSLFTSLTFAEDSVIGVDVQSDSSLNYSITDNSVRKALESPIITNLSPNIGAPGLYLNKSKRDSNADEDFNQKNFGSLFKKKKLKKSVIHSYAYRWWINKAISTEEVAVDRSEEELILLDEAPIGEDVWQTSFIRVWKNDDEESLERVLCTGIEQAQLVSNNSMYFTMTYEVSEFSQVSQKGFGVGATFSQNFNGDKAISGGTTIGKANSKGNVFKGGYFEITFWNKGESSLNRKKEISVKNFPGLESVLFDYDSAEIKDNNQLRAIAKLTGAIELSLKDLAYNETLFFLGSASEEGTIKYNKELGRRRAHAVYLAVMMNLYQKGYNLDEIGDKVQFESKGELYPDSIQNEKNRKVSFYRFTNLSNLSS